MKKSTEPADWRDHGDGTWSFTLAGLGWRKASFSVDVNGRTRRSDGDYDVSPGILNGESTRESIAVVERGATHIVLRRDITNVTDRPIAVKDIRDFVCTESLLLGGPVSASYVYHAECPFEWGRYRVGFGDMLDPPPRTLLGDPVSPHFGATGWSPYTAVVFANTESGSALIEGALSQKRFYRYWTPRPDGRVDSLMGMYGIDAKTVQPDETLDGELIYLEVVPRFDPLNPFETYNETLRRHIDFHSPKIRHERDLVWGSWNDGPYNMVHDFIVRRNADFCRKHFPSVTWIQIDEGYQVRADVLIQAQPDNPDTGAGRERLAHYHYLERENAGISARKFPYGMRACADYIGAAGLRPAVWTGLNVCPSAQVVRDHPDWFQDNLQLPGITNVLNPDVSIPECMEVIREGFRRIVEEYGFEGIKLDFWTYSLIANQRPYAKPFRYSLGNRTGLEYMHELLGYVRGLIEDGYLQPGCDVSMGNPFLGAYCDNFRYGIDVGEGKWENILFGARCMAFLATATHRLGYLANSDSIGVMEALSPSERRTWMNFCFVSGSMLEIGGDFAAATKELDPEYVKQGRPQLLEKKFGCPPDALADLQRITADIQNGTRITFPDASFFEGDMPPALWIKCDADDRPAYLAAFNWTETETEISLDLPACRGMQLRDFWHDSDTFRVADVPLSLDPHASRLFVINPKSR